MQASTQARKPISPLVEGSARDSVSHSSQEKPGEGCTPRRSHYEADPEALERAIARRRLHDELLDGLDVCNYALDNDVEDLETEGSRLLKQELAVLLDRFDSFLRKAVSA
jgi:hypothetical protein